MTRTASVYRAFDVDGVLLYVGQSTRPTERIAHHRTHKTWAPLVERWDIGDPMPVGDALDVEAEAIIAERPVHNVAGTSISAIYARWKTSITPRQKSVAWAISAHLLGDVLVPLDELRPFEERMAEAIEVVRKANPSITNVELRWALENWFGPPSLHRA